MAQSLPHLHYPHDSGIDLVLTILKDPFCGAGLLLHLEVKHKSSLFQVYSPRVFALSKSFFFFYRLFHLNLVYFDPEQLVFEVIVAGKLVPIFHVFAFGEFGEHSCFSTCKRLQCPTQFAVLCKPPHKTVRVLDKWWWMKMIKLNVLWFESEPIPVASLISSRVNSSPSLNISSTSVWKSDTCSSFLPF